MAMENDTSIADRRLIDHFKALLRKAAANSDNQSSTWNSWQDEASGEDSKVPSCITVLDETGHEVTITNAIEALNFFLVVFSSEADTAFQAVLVCRRVIDYASELSRMSGNDEKIVMYLEQVVEYLEKNPGVASAELQCLLLYLCARVFRKQGRTNKALRSCDSARKITLLITNEITKTHLEIAISMLLADIGGVHGDPHELLTIINGYLRFYGLFMFYGAPIDFVGFVREIPMGLANDPRMTLGVIEALKIALSTEHGEKDCAAILLSLANYYHNTSDSFRHHAGEILLEQAILGLRQEKCTCRSDYIVYPSAFYLVRECACHQLLAEALLYQGSNQEARGLLEEAEQSYQQGLKLSQSCQDKDREYSFHFKLMHLLMSKTHLYGNYGLPRVGEIPHDSFRQLSGAVRFHFLEFLKCAERPEDSLQKDIAITFLRALVSSDSANILELWENFIPSSTEFLEKRERAGDFRFHARTHAELSRCCLLKRDLRGTKKHFFLGLEHWKQGAAGLGMGTVHVGQALGQIALMPEIMELDHAYDLWHKVYLWTQEKLEDVARISEADALHYFETIKHASVSLSKCEMLKYGKLRDSAQGGNLTEMLTRSPLEAIGFWGQAFESLMWAERGKGKMLMSYIGALQKNLDTTVEDSRLLERLNLPPNYPVDFEGRFSRDDRFAFDILTGRPATSPKLVFIEYTCIDNKHLMTHITSGSGDSLTSRLQDLSVAIDEKIRHEAEEELDSLQIASSSNSEVGSQPFTEPIKAGSCFRKEVGSGAEAANKVLSAMNKIGPNRIPFNRWIPGIVAGIQRRATKVLLLRKRNKSIQIQEVEREIRQLLQILYKVLIKPDEEYLFAGSSTRDIVTLVFVPHEDLGVIPFAALHEQDGSAYLIEQFAVLVSPAIWCSRHCEYLYEKKVLSGQAELKPVLVGRKSGYKPPFGDLQEAHKEVQAVFEAIGSAAACEKVIDDSAAPDMSAGMKESVTAILPHASWIHLSVHGEISPQFPQGSLLFGDNDDQRLTANEIITSASSSSPWNAQCVIASACQSGLGTVAGGGIMSFARSFILAGVPSCVLSMWEVNQSFCTSFMGELYSELRSGETLGHAMRNTMISMMKREKPKPTHKKRQSKRFKEPITPIEPESGEPIWSILDWAAFSCFGFPGVKLITAIYNAKGKSPIEESAHGPLPVQHQEVDSHRQPSFEAMPGREIHELMRSGRRNRVNPTLGTQDPKQESSQNPVRASHATYKGPHMTFTLFPIHEELPPQYRLATVQEVRDNRQALLEQMPRKLSANLADGSVHGAALGGDIRKETWRDDFRYKLATLHRTQADPRRDPSVTSARSGMTFTAFPLGEELPPQYRLATVQEVLDNREAMLRAMPGWQISNLADGSVDGAFYGGHTRGKTWRDGVTHNLATKDPQQVDPGRDPSATKAAGQGLTFSMIPIGEELPSLCRLATQQEVRDNREALLQTMPGWQIANLADGSVTGACYGGHTRTERLDGAHHNLAITGLAQANPGPDPTPAKPGQDPTEADPRRDATASDAGPGVAFTLFPLDTDLPPHYRLATRQEVLDNREALLRAMPGWQIANLADGSVDGARYGGCTKMSIRNDVGHKLATRVKQDVVDSDFEDLYG